MIFRVLLIALLLLVFLVRTSEVKETIISYYQYKTAPVKQTISLENKDSLEFERAFGAVTNLIDTKSGTYGLLIKDYKSGQTYAFNSDTQFYAASLYKVPIATALLVESQKRSNLLDSRVPGTRSSYVQVLTTLLKNSDNNAQQILINSLGSFKIQQEFNRLSSENSKFYSLNQSSPTEILLVFENIIQKDDLSEENRSLFFTLLETTSYDNRIHLGLSKSLKFSHKIGTWPDERNWHDCGFVYRSNIKEEPVFVCLMSENTTEKEFLEIAERVGQFISNLR